MSVIDPSPAVEDFRQRAIASRPRDLTQTPVADVLRLSPRRAFVLPLVFILSLSACGLFESVRQNPVLLWSVLGAGLALFVWNAMFCVLALRNGRRLALVVLLRKQHYVQACAQGSVLLYWGWYWRQTYDAAPLIVAQIVFATSMPWRGRDGTPMRSGSPRFLSSSASICSSGSSRTGFTSSS